MYQTDKIIKQNWNKFSKKVDNAITEGFNNDRSTYHVEKLIRIQEDLGKASHEFINIVEIRLNQLVIDHANYSKK